MPQRKTSTKKRTTRRNELDELRERVLAHFTTLRLPLSGDELDAVLSRAERERLGALRVVDLLLGDIARDRHERSVQRRIDAAKFRDLSTLEGFDWSFNAKNIDRAQIEQLATCDFVRRRENLVLIGQSGVGKSHIVQAIGIRACAMGYRVRYATSAKLIDILRASLADESLPRRLRQLRAPDLLIIDEFAFDHIERLACRQAASLLYKVIDGRHGERSTVLVSNVDFKKWDDYLGDAPLTMAFIDRLIDRATVLKIAGKSYRAQRPPRA